MAILSETSDDGRNISVEDYLARLDVPPEYSRFEALESETLDRLDLWKDNALEALQELRILLRQRTTHASEKDDGDIIFSVATFQGDGEWSSESMNDVSAGILESYHPLSLSLLEDVLVRHIRPVFQANPHPSLNVHTGRKLPRAAGGPMASQDAYEGQTWKEHPGVGNVLLWCVRRIDTDLYERLWYLVIPPTMTLLDDFEVPHKLEGIRVASAMLQKAPPNLLRRTGVVDLLFTSLQRGLTFLHSPSTPILIRASVPPAVDLVLRMAQPGTETRFNQLCALLGDGIIGSVWMYGYQDPEAIEASVDVLPLLVNALDIGAVRYLKAIIPQLTHTLHPNPDRPDRRTLQLASLKALSSVLHACAPRIVKWKGTILEAIVKCWVALVDSSKTDAAELKEALRDTCVQLLQAAPLVHEDYERLLALDSHMFAGLLRDMNVSDTRTQSQEIF